MSNKSQSGGSQNNVSKLINDNILEIEEKYLVVKDTEKKLLERYLHQ